MKALLRLAALISMMLPASAMAIEQGPGSSPSSPARPGITVTGIVECGEGYTSHELYDMRITLVEVVRGEEAWKRIREASTSNKAPAGGTEYLLARIKFEYFSRSNPGLCIHPLVPDAFTAYSADGQDYAAASITPPKPELRKNLRAGEACEGWIAFEVSREDKSPLMCYSADSGGAVQHGGSKWFLLK